MEEGVDIRWLAEGVHSHELAEGVDIHRLVEGVHIGDIHELAEGVHIHECDDGNDSNGGLCQHNVLDHMAAAAVRNENERWEEDLPVQNSKGSHPLGMAKPSSA